MYFNDLDVMDYFVIGSKLSTGVVYQKVHIKTKGDGMLDVNTGTIYRPTKSEVKKVTRTFKCKEDIVIVENYV